MPAYTNFLPQLWSALALSEHRTLHERATLSCINVFTRLLARATLKQRARPINVLLREYRLADSLLEPQPDAQTMAALFFLCFSAQHGPKVDYVLSLRDDSILRVAERIFHTLSLLPMVHAPHISYEVPITHFEQFAADHRGVLTASVRFVLRHRNGVYEQRDIVIYRIEYAYSLNTERALSRVALVHIDERCARSDVENVCSIVNNSVTHSRSMPAARKLRWFVQTLPAILISCTSRLSTYHSCMSTSVDLSLVRSSLTWWAEDRCLCIYDCRRFIDLIDAYVDRRVLSSFELKALDICCPRSLRAFRKYIIDVFALCRNRPGWFICQSVLQAAACVRTPLTKKTRTLKE